MERGKEFLQHRIDRLERQAEQRAANRQFPESIALLEEACNLSLQWSKRSRGSADPRNHRLAQHYRRIGSRERDGHAGRRIATLERKTGGLDELSYACTLTSLGALRCEMGHYEPALRSFRQVFEIANGHPSADGLIVATAAINLAGAHFYLEQYRASEALYREALASLEALSRPATLELLSCLSSLAELRELSGDREAAVQLAHQAHEAVRQATDAGPEDLAEGLVWVAEFYGQIGEFHRALLLVHESALLLEKSGRSRSEELMLCLERLARLSSDGSNDRLDAGFGKAAPLEGDEP